ncbi:hypothetical protein AY599_13210 [Leptolyngbya valderiana BDU 20041]|nr:hypothetical protein AY599_13210 [Leptolyngbya valderiana BDU 20041]
MSSQLRVFHQIFDRQILDDDRLVLTNESSRQFVQGVAPRIFNLFVNFGNLTTRLLSVTRTLHLARQGFLSTSQTSVVFCQVAGIFHLFTVRGDGEMGDSHIDTNRFLGFGKRFEGIVVYPDGNVPTPRGRESYRDSRWFRPKGKLTTPSDVEWFLVFRQIQRTVSPTKRRFRELGAASVPFLFKAGILGASSEKVSIPPI